MNVEHRQPRVLVVDDEPQLVSVLSYALQNEHFEAIPAYDGRQALEVVRSQEVDLALVDLNLPDCDGISLCEQLRTYVPVILVTARSDQADKNRGLAAGADDYITKPFSVEELTLRVRAVLRRTRASPRILRVGCLTVDSSLHEAAIEGQRMDLTPLEFDLLRHLAVHRDRVVPTAELVREVWGVAQLAVSDPLVKNAVYRLRRKLPSAQTGGVTIANVRGVGYRLLAE